MDGLIARGWETSILQMLKRDSAKLAHEEVARKFDGYSEAWITASFHASTPHELMEKVKDDEEKPKGLRLPSKTTNPFKRRDSASSES